MAIRHAPSARRVGFQLDAPDDVDFVAKGPGVAGRECHGERTIGEVEVEVFEAALVIDRDGILERKLRDAIGHAAEPGARISVATPVALPNASGFRADAEVVRPMGAPRPDLPYVYVFAIAPNDLGIDSGVVVTMRCATRSWPAAEKMLGSLRLLTTRTISANDREAAPIALPLVTD